MATAESLPTAPISADAPTLAFDRAFADLTQALQEFLSTTAQHERVNAAYLEYAGFVQAVMAGHDVQEQGASAYAKYVQALQEALSPPAHQQRTLDAFDRYARATRDAWIAIDPRALTPVTVAAIAQQLLTAASTVAGIAGAQATPTGGVSPPQSSTPF